ncbi:MAG TPA: hypothetical protein VN026_13885 [Bacteroidia bacterium]|jgi:hypothetical protein|nr:hypothetical protein [Bacteroidia bacterium]
MEQIQAYSKDALVKIKQWLWQMKEKGHNKYFEIYVDRKRVVEKTDNLADFGVYKVWLHDTAEMIRVMIYDNETIMHRMEVFCFRTPYYDKRQKKIALQNSKDTKNKVLEAENKMLKEKLIQAEEYIVVLENKINEGKSDTPKFQDNVNGSFVNLLNALTEKVKQAA